MVGLRDPWTFRSVGESSGVDEATVNGVRDITDHQAHEPNSSDIVGQTFSDLVDANDRSPFHKTLATVGPLARIEYARTAPTTASFFLEIRLDDLQDYVLAHGVAPLRLLRPQDQAADGSDRVLPIQDAYSAE